MALTKVPSNLDATVAITQSASDNSTNVATTAYVDTAITNLIDGAPGTLNTLDEIAAALNDDAALNTTLTTSIATKLPLAGGTLTGNVSLTTASYPKITLTDETGVDRAFSIGTDNETFTIRNETASSNPFVISNANNATFVGEVRGGAFSVGAGPTSELLFLSGAGHNGHGTTNARSLASFNATGQSAGLWFGARNDETTGIIGTRTATGNLAFETYNSGWGERMRITYDGKVGIGTDSPGRALEVSTDGTAQFRLSRVDSTINGNNTLGTIEFWGTDDTSGTIGATIVAHAASTWGGGAYPTDLRFSTMDGSTLSEQMRITRLGDVSIGSDHGGFSGWRVLNLRGQATGALYNFEASDGTRRAAIANSGSELRLQTFLSDGAITFEPGTGTEKMRIDSTGRVGIGVSSSLGNLLTIAHTGHGIGFDYVGSTLPSIAGLFTSSIGMTETAYGDLNIKARTDYGGYYGIGFFTSVTNSTPRKAMAITSSAEIEHHPSTGSGLHIEKVLPRVTPNYPNAGQSGTAENWYQPPRGESGIIHYGNTNDSGGEYRCAGFIVYSAAEANNTPPSITISVTESVGGNMVAFDVSGGYIRVQNTYGYGIELMGYVQAFRRG